MAKTIWEQKQRIPSKKRPEGSIHHSPRHRRGIGLVFHQRPERSRQRVSIMSHSLAREQTHGIPAKKRPEGSIHHSPRHRRGMGLVFHQRPERSRQRISIMSQSLAQIYVHLVFSTKNRQPSIDDDIKSKLHAYIAVCLRDNGCHVFKVGGINDHVHICLSLAKAMSVSKVAEIAKGASSKWMKNQGEKYTSFFWQAGYGAFSISPGHKDALVEYIQNQETHHAKESFQDEFRRLCAMYQVPLDERYVWD